jgi:hypothetical protein
MADNPGGRPPHERANSLYILVAAVAAVGVLPYLVGNAEITGHHHVWQNGWVRLAFAFWLVALLVLLWGLWVNTSHAGRRWLARRHVRRSEKAEALQRQVEQSIIEIMRRREEALREDRAKHWQILVQWGLGQDGNPAFLCYLTQPGDASEDPFTGQTALCQLSKGATVVSASLQYVPGYHGFIAAYPQGFGDDPLPTARRVASLVVIERPRSGQRQSIPTRTLSC